MNKKDAIAGSVEKWRKLLAGEMAAGEAFNQCSLCCYTRDVAGRWRFHCPMCPLYQVGLGCCEDDSPFVAMQDAWDEDEARTIDHPAIRPHAEAMYAALLAIQEEENNEG